ncbi:MAG TPA: GWxTD domain-containing protein [candidate division Zixibacteria bacterium]|nr:GWxTD domain-containing protein [candidate division Zixibacteria bacterium]
MYKPVIALLIILLSLSGVSYAQDFEAPAAQEKIASWLDFAAYQIDNYKEFALVEFYYSLLRHDLTFEDFDSTYEASIEVWLEIFNEKGAPVDTLGKVIATRIKDPAELTKKSIRIIDALQALMRPGKYSVKLTVEDVNSRTDGEEFTGKYGERQIMVEIPDFSEQSEIQLSTIELAYNIELLKEKDTMGINPLYKSDRYIVPNPTGVFINTDSLMYFYAEIYNLEYGPDISRDYYVNYMIKDVEGNIVADYGKRKYFKPGTSAIISSAIDISDLREGRFTFFLQVEDAENNSISAASKRFQLIYETFEMAPAVPEEQFTEEDAVEMEKILRFLATKEEKEQYKNADLEGKKDVIKTFWGRRDPTPDTRYNEFKETIFRRFQYANEKYSVNLIDKSDGWKTDRGRIYIKYGEPDEIERRPSSMELEPFERWIYYNYPQQGQIYFIFVDESGYGNFELKHSNAQGEIVDYEWEQRLESQDPFNTGF